MNTLHLPDMKVSAAKQFNYYVIPKMLINDPAFSELNPTAKLIYSLMLNRAALSAAHPDKFTDEHGRFFIIYTIEQLMQEMLLSKPTCVKMVQQLCDIGLIEKRRRGQGKPSFIYLKDFAAVGQNVQPTASGDDSLQAEGTGNDFGAEPPQDETNEYASENSANSRSKESLLQEVNSGNPTDKKSSSLTPRSKDSLPQEVKGVDSRKNDKRKQKIKKDYPSFPPTSQGVVSPSGDFENPEELTEDVKDQIEFHVLAERFGEEEAQEILNLIVDTLSLHRREISIGGNRYAAELVKDRFRSLTYEHVSAVMEKLGELAGVRNPHAYLRAMLFNAASCSALIDRALFMGTYDAR